MQKFARRRQNYMQALLFEEDNFRSVFASKCKWREALKILGVHSIIGKKRKKMYITQTVQHRLVKNVGLQHFRNTENQLLTYEEVHRFQKISQLFQS